MTETVFTIIANAFFAFGAAVTVYFIIMLCKEEFGK